MVSGKTRSGWLPSTFCMASVVKTGLWYLDGKVCLCPMSSSNVFGSISVNAVRSETPFHQSFRCQDASISVNAERSETPFKSTDDYQKAFMDPFAIFCERTIPRKFFFLSIICHLMSYRKVCLRMPVNLHPVNLHSFRLSLSPSIKTTIRSCPCGIPTKIGH